MHKHGRGTQPTRIAVSGAGGRMGKEIIAACQGVSELCLSAAIEHQGHPMIGHDAGKIAGIATTDVSCHAHIDEVIDKFDVLIDFTRPEATLANLDVCRRHGKRMVIGTTGLTDDQKAVVKSAAASVGVVMAPNMSIGVNLCLKLLATAARILGDEFDVEIIEAHHRHKVDAPSGTALRMGEVIAGALSRDLRECAIYGRLGNTGERPPREIGFETIRAGDIVGEHTVMFAAAGERVEISHKATSRRTFANGALRAAAWVAGQPHGLFDMEDVLGLRGAAE